MKKAGVLGQEPVVHGHPTVEEVIASELLGAVLVVVLARVQVLEVRFVYPRLKGALTKGALAAGPRSSVPLYWGFISRFSCKGRDGDEAGVLKAHQVKLNTNINVEPAQALL